MRRTQRPELPAIIGSISDYTQAQRIGPGRAKARPLTELTAYHIPEQKSYHLIPEPATLFLLGLGGLALLRKRRT